VRYLVAFALAACSSHPHAASPDAAADAPQTVDQCEATFEHGVDRACATSADCVLLAHAGCCSEIELGVAKAGQLAASMVEAAYDSCISAACWGRGCGGLTTAEDGSYPATTGQAFVAICVNQRCTSTVQ
jgi:hypothetical protein